MRKMPVRNLAELMKSLRRDLRDRVDGISQAAAVGMADIVREKFSRVDDRSDNLGPVVPEFNSQRTATGAKARVFVPASDPKATKAKTLNALRSPTPFGSTWNELRSKKKMLDLLKEQGIS